MVDFFQKCRRAHEVLEGCTPRVRDWLFIFRENWKAKVLAEECEVDSLPYREQFAKETGLTLCPQHYFTSHPTSCGLTEHMGFNTNTPPMCSTERTGNRSTHQK